MRKLWIWIGSGFALISVAAVGVFALASVGDVLFVAQPVDQNDIPGAAKTAAASAVNSLFGVPTDKVISAMCWRVDATNADLWECRACGDAPLSDAEYAQLDIAGQLNDPKATTVVRCRNLDATNLSDWESYVSAAHGKTLADLHRFDLWRRDGAPTTIDTRYWPIKSLSASTYRTERQKQNSDVLRPFAIVEE